MLCSNKHACVCTLMYSTYGLYFRLGEVDKPALWELMLCSIVSSSSFILKSVSKQQLHYNPPICKGCQVPVPSVHRAQWHCANLEFTPLIFTVQTLNRFKTSWRQKNSCITEYVPAVNLSARSALSLGKHEMFKPVCLYYERCQLR